jgi:chaperonin GroEL
VQAVLCAIEEGVVQGGATTYLRAGHEYVNLSPDSDKEADESLVAGEYIVLQALAAPFNQLIENSGAEVTIHDILQTDGVFDFRNFELIKTKQAEIIDPAKVERIALENAVSIAVVFLQTDVVLVSK